MKHRNIEVAWQCLYLNNVNTCIKTRWGATARRMILNRTLLTEGQTGTFSHSYCKYKVILLYSFWVSSTAVMCIPMPYLLPTFVYKKNIYYHNNEDDDDETNDDDDHYYCISIVYVADLYWLFTTVEQTLYSETYPVSVEFLYILYLLNEEKKNPPWQLQSRMPLSDYQEVFSLVSVIREMMKGSNGKKRKLKIWKNVIHCCKCNGQNVSRVSIVKPCVLFSVFL